LRHCCWVTLGGGAVPVTTKRSNIACVNGAVATTIIVAGLALAGYALLMTALNHRMNVPMLVAVGALEILLLVQVGVIVAKLAHGDHPTAMATLIGYLIATPLVPVAAAFWGLIERSRWGPAVVAVAGLVAAVLMVRLHQIWPVIHV
jgi:predicted homoserine dehydrogenase-like protein